MSRPGGKYRTLAKRSSQRTPDDHPHRGGSPVVEDHRRRGPDRPLCAAESAESPHSRPAHRRLLARRRRPGSVTGCAIGLQALEVDRLRVGGGPEHGPGKPRVSVSATAVGWLGRSSGLGPGRGLGCAHEPGRRCWFPPGPRYEWPPGRRRLTANGCGGRWPRCTRSSSGPGACAVRGE
jgi:hypothetical protein